MIGSKRAGFVACGIGLVSVLTGCGGGSKGFLNSAQGANVLPGTWIKRGLSYQGRDISCPNRIDMSTDKTVVNLSVNSIVVDSCGYDETIQFDVNGVKGTYKIAIPGPRLGQLVEESGVYTVSGNRLTLTSTAVGFDTDGSNKIESGEKTTLVSVTNTGNIPANPRQRSVFTWEADGSTLTLTPVAQALTNSSGATVVNADGTINARITGAEILYGR